MHYARSKKEIRKTEIEKKKEQKKIEKGSGSHFGPATEAATAQHHLHPKRYRLPSLSPLTGRTHRSDRLPPPAVTSPLETVTVTVALSPITLEPERRLPSAPYKSPALLLLLPLSPLLKSPQIERIARRNSAKLPPSLLDSAAVR
jgi:hypothetical protein